MAADKVIITAALAGGATTKEQNPAVPYKPEEFAEEARKCYESGCSIVHVHAKDPSTGRGTPDMDLIRPVFQAIRESAPKLIINLSSAIAAGTAPEKRIGPILELKPEMASLNTNTMNFALADHRTGKIIREVIFDNKFEMIAEFAKKMKENGTKPELEAYDTSGIYNTLLLRRRGDLFEEPMHWQFVFGVLGGTQFTPLTLSLERSLIPEGHTWSTCGVGPNQVPALMTAVNMGGHLRVGLEDNVRVPSGELAKGNWEQVEIAAQIAKIAGRPIASPDEARKLLRLKPG